MNINKNCFFCQKPITGIKYPLEKRDYKYWQMDERVPRYCCPDCYRKQLLHMRTLQKMKKTIGEELDEYE